MEIVKLLQQLPCGIRMLIVNNRNEQYEHKFLQVIQPELLV